MGRRCQHVEMAARAVPFRGNETILNYYSSTSLLIYERAGNNMTVRLVFGRFIFRYAGAERRFSLSYARKRLLKTQLKTILPLIFAK